MTRPNLAPRSAAKEGTKPVLKGSSEGLTSRGESGFVATGVGKSGRVDHHPTRRRLALGKVLVDERAPQGVSQALRLKKVRWSAM